MSMQSIRDRYGVPAKRGGRIRYTANGAPHDGTIVASRGDHLRIRLDGLKWIGNYHPTWEIEYLEETREANK